MELFVGAEVPVALPSWVKDGCQTRRLTKSPSYFNVGYVIWQEERRAK